MSISSLPSSPLLCSLRWASVWSFNNTTYCTCRPPVGFGEFYELSPSFASIWAVQLQLELTQQIGVFLLLQILYNESDLCSATETCLYRICLSPHLRRGRSASIREGAVRCSKVPCQLSCETDRLRDYPDCTRFENRFIASRLIGCSRDHKPAFRNFIHALVSRPSSVIITDGTLLLPRLENLFDDTIRSPSQTDFRRFQHRHSQFGVYELV